MSCAYLKENVPSAAGRKAKSPNRTLNTNTQKVRRMAKTLDVILRKLLVTTDINDRPERVDSVLEEAKAAIIAWAISRLPEKKYKRESEYALCEYGAGWNACITESERRLRSAAPKC